MFELCRNYNVVRTRADPTDFKAHFLVTVCAQICDPRLLLHDDIQLCPVPASVALIDLNFCFVDINWRRQLKGDLIQVCSRRNYSGFVIRL